MVPSVAETKGRTLFFGYGSLMFAGGINGRGMFHQYTNDELFTGTLKGFRRGGFNTVDTRFGGLTFYSIVGNKKHHIAGVLFEIDNDHDLIALLQNEGVNIREGAKQHFYEVIDVTDKMEGVELAEGDRVLTLKNPTGKKAKEKPLYPVYQARCWNGIQFWPEEFIKEFLATGGQRHERKMPEVFEMAKTRKRKRRVSGSS